MVDAQVMDLTVVCRNFPTNDGPQIEREYIIEALETVFGGETPCCTQSEIRPPAPCHDLQYCFCSAGFVDLDTRYQRGRRTRRARMRAL